MEAYKFLDRQGSTVITGTRWPRPDGDQPGAWLHAPSVRPCREGIHACRPQDLAWWIHHELWVIELDGDVVEADHKVAASRGRLLRRIDAWPDSVGAELGVWCAWRARDHAVAVTADHDGSSWSAALANATTLEGLAAAADEASAALGEASAAGRAAGLAADAARFAGGPHFAGPPFVAACVAGHAASARSQDRADFDAGYAAARRDQSNWIAARLGLA